MTTQAGCMSGSSLLGTESEVAMVAATAAAMVAEVREAEAKAAVRAGHRSLRLRNISLHADR